MEWRKLHKPIAISRENHLLESLARWIYWTGIRYKALSNCGTGLGRKLPKREQIRRDRKSGRRRSNRGTRADACATANRAISPGSPPGDSCRPGLCACAGHRRSEV